MLQVTTAAEDAQQPVSRMRNADATGFPIAQRAWGDLEQIGAFGLRQPKPETGLQESPGVVPTLQRRASKGRPLGCLRFRIMPIMY